MITFDVRGWTQVQNDEDKIILNIQELDHQEQEYIVDLLDPSQMKALRKIATVAGDESAETAPILHVLSSLVGKQVTLNGDFHV